MLNINCPCTHVTGTACVSKLASAVVTCSIFSSASHSIVHLSSRRLITVLNCRQMSHPNEPGMAAIFILVEHLFQTIGHHQCSADTE